MNANVKPRSRRKATPEGESVELELTNAQPPQAPPKSGEALPAAEQSVCADGSSPAPGTGEPSTALTIPDRARIALKSEQTERDLLAMVEQSKSVMTITNADGRKQAHAMLMGYVRARGTLDEVDEAAREELKKLNKGILTEKGRLLGLIESEEARIRKLRDDWDEGIERQKKAAADAEAARIRKIQGNIEFLRAITDMAFGATSTNIASAIRDLVAIEIGDEYAEFKETAATVKDMTLGKLRTMHQAALDAEANARKVAEQEEANRVERARIAEDNRVAESARQRRQLADDEIRSIAQILTNADRRGTLEAFDEAIRIGAAWVIDDSRFFGHVASVSDALNDVRALLVERRATLVKKLADEATAKAMAEARERAMEAIRGIQERLHLAAEGDSLEAYDLAISCTEGEAITEDRFGAMVSTATIFKTNTLATLRQRRETVAKRLATAAELEEKRLAQEAEEKRQADQRAELARQEEALRLQQETMAKPSDPVEALPGEAVKMLLAIGNEVCKDAADRVESEKKPRPSDEAIVEVLMRAFSEDRATIVDWLCDLDLMALAEDEEPDFSEVALA